MTTVPNLRRLLGTRFSQIGFAVAVCVLGTGITTAFCSPAVAVSSPSRVLFSADGYLCVRDRRALVVDTETVPDCSAARGFPLGEIRRVPTIVQQTSNGPWLVTPSPMKVTGRLEGSTITIESVTTNSSRRDRFVDSMATIEVSSFLGAGAMPDPGRSPSRGVVFAALPAFASVATGATIRTARVFTGRSFRYGAHVRDPNLTDDQIAELVQVSNDRDIPIAVTRTASLVATACSGPDNGAQPDGPGLVGPFTGNARPPATSASTKWFIKHNELKASSTRCDELTQVNIISAPIVSTITFDPRLDTVVDASVRTVTVSAQAPRR